MSDPSDLATGAGIGVAGTGIIGTIVAILWKRGEKKRDRAEEQVEDTRDKQLAEALALLKTMGHELAEMRLEARVNSERFIATQAVVAEVKTRIDGISANYGPKLEAMQNAISKLEVQVAALERKGKR